MRSALMRQPLEHYLERDHDQSDSNCDLNASLERHEADLDRWRAEYSEVLAVEIESITDALLFELLMARDNQHVKQIWARLTGAHPVESRQHQEIAGRQPTAILATRPRKH